MMNAKWNRRKTAARGNAILQSAIRNPQSALTLIEILIALFIFLIGILGVLSMFPVAMNTASQTMGQTRGTILARSVLAQITADCKAAYEEGTAKENFTSGAKARELVPVRELGHTDDRVGYFVTLTSGPGKGQTRRIVEDDLTTLTVAPAWDKVEHKDSDGNWIDWKGPGDTDSTNDKYIITRLGLPGLPRGTVADGASTDDKLELSMDVEDDQWNGFYIQIVSGEEAEGEIRLITDTAETDSKLTLSQDWVSGGEPKEGDRFAITRTCPKTRCIGTISSVITTSPDALTANGSPAWADDQWNGCYVEIRSGVAEGEVRLITDTSAGNRLDISPDWDTGPPTPPTPPSPPASGDSFAVINAATRFGVVRAFTGSDSFRAGTAGNKEDVAPLVWPENNFWQDNANTLFESSPSGDGSDGGDDDKISDSGATWTDNEFVGKLVMITEDTNSHDFKITNRARLIRKNTATELTVYPDWTPLPSAWAHGSDWSNVKYKIAGSVGYFLVITSGRAAGRVFPITDHTRDAANGDEITCSGVNFREIGVREAMRANQYKLRNATGFMIIGGKGCLSSLMIRPVPHGSDATKSTGEYEYLFNTFGLPRTSEPQAGDDFVLDEISDSGKYRIDMNSEYSVIAVFSDTGALPDEPVRVDVFVFRNFDSAKSLAENRKPVAHVTGYVGRP